MCWNVGTRAKAMGKGAGGLKFEAGHGECGPECSPLLTSKMHLQKDEKSHPFCTFCMLPTLSLAFLLKIATHTHIANSWAWWEPIVCMHCQFWARRSAGESSHCPPHHDIHVFSLVSLAMVATQGSMLMYLAKIQGFWFSYICISAKLSFADGSTPFPRSSTCLMRLARAWE